MDIYGVVGIAVLAVVFLLATCLIFKHFQDDTERHNAFIDSLMEQHRKECRDLLDRLMARDLTEVKTAQAMESTSATKVISRRQNDMRLAEEARRFTDSRGEG